MLHLKEVFENLHDEWFSNQNFWFEKLLENDKYLSEKYFIHIRGISDYNNELIDQSIRCQIGAIIIFDQIPRHHDRIENINCDRFSIIASKIAASLNIILCNSLNLYQNVSAYEWCFIMLPFRHIKDYNKINGIVEFMIDRHNNINTSIKDRQIFKKFIKQTILKIYKYNTANIIEKQLINDTSQNSETNVDLMNQWTSFHEILEFCPVQSICNNQSNQIIKMFQKELETLQHHKPNIILSLSGGVDSCVCLYLLSTMYPKNKIIAAHINYNNRDENKEELLFVKKVCNVLNIKLFYRTITEITRERCKLSGMRDLYECITKDIRFDFYRQVSEQFTDDINKFENIVLLGHNKDDCFENILTNISSKKNYDNLCGTNKITYVSNINFWRPLLDVEKKEIIDFALMTNIPFLKDSTPSWSIRGQIRDTIVPSLKQINEDIVQSFFVLKERLQINEALIDTFILPIILSKFTVSDKTIIGILNDSELLCNHNIWSKILSSSLFKDMIGNSHCSYKSIQQFVEFLQRFMIKLANMRVQNMYISMTKFMLKHNIIVDIQRTETDLIKIMFCQI